jgi:hypothetical protein
MPDAPGGGRWHPTQALLCPRAPTTLTQPPPRRDDPAGAARGAVVCRERRRGDTAPRTARRGRGCEELLREARLLYFSVARAVLRLQRLLSPFGCGHVLASGSPWKCVAGFAGRGRERARETGVALESPHLKLPNAT